MRRFVIFSGVALEVAAAFALFAWIQAGDPECHYTTEVFLQLRMCDPLIVEEPPFPSYAYLGGIVLAFALGASLQVWVARGQLQERGKILS